jgi:N4-gp56 family major capsid protein
MPVQTTLNTVAPTTYLNKTYYDRTMLEWAKAQLVYAQFGQKRPIPRNSGKTVEFRRWTLFTPNKTTQALTEGVTPSSQSLGQTKVEATIAQYGAYVEISDLLDLTAYDPVINDSAELLGEQLGIVVDNVTRDAMIADASTQFAGGRANANAITATDYLTVDEIRKAVRTLKGNKARRFSGNGRSGHFVCIVDPFATYDLQSDSLWQDVSKYSNAEQIYAGEIGRLFGVVFVETTEGYVANNSGSIPVHHSLIFGADAYGVIDVAGSGVLQTIIKPRGSAGTADPLDQRSTVGGKVMGYTAKVLNALWIIDIQHAAHA